MQQGKQGTSQCQPAAALPISKALSGCLEDAGASQETRPHREEGNGETSSQEVCTVTGWEELSSIRDQSTFVYQGFYGKLSIIGNDSFAKCDGVHL